MQMPYNTTNKLGKTIGLLTLASSVVLLALCFTITREEFDRIRGITVGLGLIAAGIGCFLFIGPRRMFRLTCNHWTFTLNLVIVSLPFLLGVAYVFPFKIDDSYISMRFASNLAAGYGLVFNPGGPRVEGYTNLLLVLIEAILIRVGVHDIWAVKLLNTLCGLVIIFMICWYTWQQLRYLTFLLATTLALLVASSSPFIIWTVSGLETTMFSFFICLGIIGYSLYLYGRTKWSLLCIDLAFVLATLTRPEGLLFWATTTGHTLIFGLTRHKELLSRDRIIGILSGLILLALYGFWKMIYFGSLLPLTYIAKQKSLHFGTFVGGAARLLGFLAINGNYFVALLIVVGLILAMSFRVELKRPIWYMAGLCSIYLFYVLSLGFSVSMDDAYRFYVPLIPQMSLLLFEIAFAFQAYIRRIWAIWVASCLLTIVFLIPLRFNDLGHAWAIDLNWGVLKYQISARDISIGLDRAHIALGHYLREHAPLNGTIVLHDAGAIPYFSGLHVIDIWSLTDPRIVDLKRALALARSDHEREVILDEIRSYILSKNPEYIIQDSFGLLTDPTVRGRYKPIGIQFVYLDQYICGQQVCRYILEPWERLDAEEIKLTPSDYSH